MANLLWLQGGACSGNTMSFLNAEEPSACDLVTDFGINVVWHPSLGMELGDNLKKLLRDLVSGATPLDIFVFEGTVVKAPNGTGQWNRFAGRPMKDWVADLAKVANFVVAIGDCATWGGYPRNRAEPIRERRASVSETKPRRISRSRVQVQSWPAGDQRPGLPGASRLDHTDRRGRCDGARRRPHARRVPASKDFLREFHCSAGSGRTRVTWFRAA
jgi:NADH ubiquinone oxidoreductase, 20 Kd subunit